MKNGVSAIVIAGFTVEKAVELNRCLGLHYSIHTADNESDVIPLLDSAQADLIICQYGEERFDALKLLQEARVSHPDTVRLLAGSPGRNALKTAIKEAAVYQFVPCEFSVGQIELLVRRALENRELAYRHRHLSRDLKIAEDVLRKHKDLTKTDAGDSARFEKLVYCSPSMAALCNVAKKAAKTHLPILIQGETGTGKELMARGIHFNSERKNQPLIVQNCGGIADELLHSQLFGHKRGAFKGAVSDHLGVFPAADGGTVFLDEIGSVSPSFQVTLLRFLQTGEVNPLGSDKITKYDVRIIAASNELVDVLVSKGQFRKDLYYRLNVFQLNIPSLRNRIEDVEVIADYFARQFSGKANRHILGISPAVLEQFRLYDWPGNVRELENEIRRLIAVTDSRTLIATEHLSGHIRALKPHIKPKGIPLDLEGISLKEKVERMEAQIIANTLKRLRWNRSKAAIELGLSRVGLANKIKRYRLGAETSVA